MNPDELISVEYGQCELHVYRNRTGGVRVLVIDGPDSAGIDLPAGAAWELAAALDDWAHP